MVTQQDADIELAHLPGQVRQYLVAIIKPDPELRSRQCFDHQPFDYNLVIFFRHYKLRSGLPDYS
jgi:hypothetical protein